ncbi:pentatricopeptide repeat-containing protein At2g03880, mitochondrial-like [Rutidosis leptorrhynchoides]|uniref:pentatricopeptide repeat-containing protein At2g03880, mitochondrial-like n=1 Tax=Rutidosis leptorrhynchoides TaxID=125765 RepID=UPI003A9944F7
MLQTRPLPPVEEFNFILHDLATQEAYDSSTLVLEWFKRMSAVGISINTSTADSVIRCFCQLQLTELSFTVLGCCFRQGIVPPDASIYNTILDGFIGEDRTHEAERLFKKMFIFNNNNDDDDESTDQLLLLSKPDIVTYNTMLKGLCKVGDNFTAIGLLRLMNGRGCKPDIVSYNTVIDGLCSDLGLVNTIDDTLKLFNEMVFIKGVRPDADTYKSLIYAFSKLGSWDELHKMVKQMVDESICVDRNMVNIIVGELCKQGIYKDALGVYRRMLESGHKKYRPDLITYKLLIHLASSLGRVSYAWKLYRRLKKRGMKPDEVICNTLLDGFIYHMNKKDVAIKIFTLLPKENINKVAHFLLTGLITGTSHHCYESAQGYRDIKCSYLYHLYMHGKSYDQALDLFYYMENDVDDLNSEIEVYNILIFGANIRGRFDISRKLFHLLTIKGLEPDEVTYTLMIRGFYEEGLFKDAKRMFIRMKRSGFLSDSNGVDDVNQIPLCYLEEDDFIDSACVSVDMSGKEYGSSPPPLVATLLRLNVTEQFIKSHTLNMDPS